MGYKLSSDGRSCDGMRAVNYLHLIYTINDYDIDSTTLSHRILYTLILYGSGI